MSTEGRNAELAHVAKAHGANYSLRIILECRRVSEGGQVLPISAGFALIQGESAKPGEMGGRNVFGHDPTASIPESWRGGPVTRARYEHYLQNRTTHGAQGVGPAQLTWWEYQDRADQLGGCWRTAPNIRVGIGVLYAHFASADGDLREAFRRYNGSGRAAIRYASAQMERQRRWHDIFEREAP